MKSYLTLPITALLLFPFPGFAVHGGAEHSHKSITSSKPLTKVQVKPNEAVFEVHGIVCSFCSVGVRKKLSKLPFIDTSKYENGVLVEIEEQRVTVAIKPGTTLDVKAAFESIKSGGYEPIKVMIAGADGSVSTHTAEGK